MNKNGLEIIVMIFYTHPFFDKIPLYSNHCTYKVWSVTYHYFCVLGSILVALLLPYVL